MMKRYWLRRPGATEAEGPFNLFELHEMFREGRIDEACALQEETGQRVEELDPNAWVPLFTVYAPPPTPPKPALDPAPTEAPADEAKDGNQHRDENRLSGTKWNELWIAGRMRVTHFGTFRTIVQAIGIGGSGTVALVTLGRVVSIADRVTTTDRDTLIGWTLAGGAQWVVALLLIMAFGNLLADAVDLIAEIANRSHDQTKQP